jgi:hypothetical protein
LFKEFAEETDTELAVLRNREGVAVGVLDEHDVGAYLSIDGPSGASQLSNGLRPGTESKVAQWLKRI